MHRQKTYAIQAAAVVFMLGALYLASLGVLRHNMLIVAVNVALIAANFALCVWQYRVRANLERGPSIPPPRKYTER